MLSYIVNDWDTCARLLGSAFSRYNGLTNSAKLEFITQLIVGECASNPFNARPFLYAREIIAEFEKEMKPRSAEVLLQHAISFGFLYRAVSGGKRRHPNLATKVESRSHIALLPLGRALRSSQCLGSDVEKFKLFLWEYALLERDFDMYGLMIKMAEEDGGQMVGKDKWFGKFMEMRKAQIEWMKKNITHAPHREIIQHHIPWIGEEVWSGKYKPNGDKKYIRQFKLDELFELSPTSQGHHYGQRVRWSGFFKHVINSKLTPSGELLAKKLPQTKQTDEHPFFWMAPCKECVESRWLSKVEIPKHHCAPAWNLLRPRPSTLSHPSDEFVEKVTDYMEISFPFTKLANFNHASLDVVVPYVYFLESQQGFGERVDLKILFEKVLMNNKDKFVCTLRANNLDKSYYHLRGT